MSHQPSSVEEFHRSVTRLGQRRAYTRDFYARILEAKWRFVLLGSFLAFMAANLVFATLYQLAGRCIEGTDGGFLDAFFFSVQTMSTIGYGAMHPALACGDAIVVIEAWVGLIGVAVVTGLVFAKFARPSAGALFSSVAVIAKRNGQPALMFRLANERGSEIVEATVSATVLMDDITQEGHHMRKLHDLELMRSRTPILLMSWLVVHPIDERSPLYGKTKEDFEKGDLRIVVSLTGIDGVFKQVVYSYCMYLHQDVIFDHVFEDVISRDDGGQYILDLRRFDCTEPATDRLDQ